MLRALVVRESRRKEAWRSLAVGGKSCWRMKNTKSDSSKPRTSPAYPSFESLSKEPTTTSSSSPASNPISDTPAKPSSSQSSSSSSTDLFSSSTSPTVDPFASPSFATSDASTPSSSSSSSAMTASKTFSTPSSSSTPQAYTIPEYLKGDEEPPRIMYPGHIPTSYTQKVFVMFYSAFGALFNPERGDLVAALGDSTGLHALRSIHHKMCRDPIGRRILRERPRVKKDKIMFDSLRELPEGTFGREYLKYMEAHHFDPDERTEVRYVDDEDLAYVLQRYRECHDFWHTLSGLPPTVPGELALKWFEMVQTGLPVTALSAFFGPLRLSNAERYELTVKYIPWASRVAKESAYLMNVYYEKLFEVPIDEVRDRLGFYPAPK